MTWFKVDDSFYDHPKVFDAPDCAVALWLRAGTWSARNLTDGFVPSGMPARFCDDHERAVRDLMTRGLWKRARGGYQFHDWRDYQPSAGNVKSVREKRAEAGRKGGLSSGMTRSKPQSKTEANASPVASHLLEPPTRPDPALKGGTALGVTAGRARASPEPPRNCPKHIDDPDPPPCGACADARRHHGRWEADRSARLVAAPKCRRHRGQPADNCALCRSERLAPGDAA
jgi:general stress protein YciG